jgi:hypothetical protein
MHIRDYILSNLSWGVALGIKREGYKMRMRV